MDETKLDLEKPNAAGALDRMTTNVAIALLAVVPTFLVCIATPWRLAGLLSADTPEGRSGMLLAPGAFFPLSLLVSMIAGAMLTTPELANNNGAFLGPQLALSIQETVSEGNIWKTIGTVMPIYAFAVLAGALGAVLAPLARYDWGLRVSLRAAFYVVGAFVSWVILSTAAIDIVRASTRNGQLVETMTMLMTIPTLGVIYWMYFWLFRNGGERSYLRSGLLSGLMLALLFAAVLAMGLLFML